MTTPQPGDRVRVTRTTVTHPEFEVFEGYWAKADQPAESGHHAIDTDDGTWMRVRDQGPLTFGTSTGGAYTEIDTIEVIEARDGAPHEHLLASYVPTRPAISPALATARRRVGIAVVAYYVIVVALVALIPVAFLTGFSLSGTALTVVLAIMVLLGGPLNTWAHRTDHAVKQETSQ